jgi:hypothetical protein
MKITSGGTPGPRLVDHLANLNNNVYGRLPDAPTVKLVPAGFGYRVRRYAPRPIVLAYSVFVVLRSASSLVTILGKPSSKRDQESPPSRVRKTPILVDAYTISGLYWSITSELIGTSGRASVGSRPLALLQCWPPSRETQTCAMPQPA